ncbi:hypothetical protein ACLKA7_011390 [Drosophila subpalustris]
MRMLDPLCRVVVATSVCWCILKSSLQSSKHSQFYSESVAIQIYKFSFSFAEKREKTPRCVMMRLPH